MTWRYFSATAERAMDLLNNALQLGPLPASGLPLGGKTLIFTTPSQTVTFPGAANATVTLAQVITSLKAVTGLRLGRRSTANPDGAPGAWFYLALWRDGGFVLAETGTANALLKLSASVATTGKSPLSLAAVKSISRDPGTGEYQCVVGGIDADFDNPNADGSSQTPGAGGGGGNVSVP